MKKVLLISILAFASVAVGVAQTQYKLEKGNISTELQFSLLNINVSGENNGHFTLPGLRMRYAITDKWAFRTTLGFDFGHNSAKGTYDNYYTGSYTSKSSYTDFSVLPGIEYHFGKWERMSIYVGGELLLGIKTTKSAYNYNVSRTDYYYYPINEELDIKGKNCEYDINTYNFQNSYGEPNGHIAFGGNAVTGIDFYVYKGLYLGAELSFGYAYKTSLKGHLEGTYKRTENGSTTSESIDKDITDKISSGNLAFKCNPMIRLGWKF